MIKITDINGKTHYMHADAIAKITEAGASSAWHGIRSFVRTFEAETIEARESPDDIAKQIDAAMPSAAKGRSNG